MTVAPRLLGLALSASLAAQPVLAAPETVLDYRKNQAPDPAIPESVRAKLSAEIRALDPRIADALGGDFVVLGRADGSFTTGDRREELYLLARTAPIAAEPFPSGPAQVLLIRAGGKPVALRSLAPGQVYQRIAAALDSDGDGRSEALLESAAYNMGQSVTSLDLIGFGADAAPSTRQRLGEVAYDGCDNLRGETARRAATIVRNAGRLAVQTHRLPCR